MIFTTLRGRKARRLWILDADLAGAFDHIDHDQLLANIGLFPARGMIRRWLKAGVIEKGRLTPTGEGAPQGALCEASHNPPYEQRWLCAVLDRFRW